ncbi:hypothetical protein [Candidatus Paracaedibacter symbiosus]|uniref:hypothetical protein n=1 Tax=Candidatus Paracaedibacter symbiosus TaxID=244582 RepID=UPI0012EB2BA0|nr:hypothetical protein [Candidatus Paracaedibacter symbiosus]
MAEKVQDTVACYNLLNILEIKSQMQKKISGTIIPNIGLLPLVLTIAGCASVTYEEPKSGSVARVRFVTNTDGGTIVRGYRSKECDGEYEMMRLRNGFLFNSDPRRLGIPLWNYHKNAAKEFFISAGIPQVYMFEGNELNERYSYKCGTVMQQIFEAGKDYEINYKWHKSNCTLRIYEIKTSTSGSAEKVLLQERGNRLSSEFSNACLQKFKQVRWY